MNKIKFSHRYTKHPFNVRSGSKVKLIEVLNTRFEDLHESFVEYDARTVNGHLYPLPKKGDCLVLLFFGDGLTTDHGELFTTIRRSTPDKERYYRGLCGQRLIVEISE